jgi:hypothetical protein
MSESYDVGTRAWQPDTTEGWIASEVIKKTINGNKVELVFELENGEVGTCSPQEGASLYSVDAADQVLMRADQKVGGLSGGPPVRELLRAAALDEPDDARGQR